MEDQRERPNKPGGTVDARPTPRLEKKVSRANISATKPQEPVDSEVSVAPPLPPWDRTVDIVCHDRHHHSEPRIHHTDETFNATLLAFLTDGHARKPEEKGFFRLPISIRFRIIQHLLPLQSRPVTLSRPVFTKAVWPNDSLRSLKKALSPLKRYMAVNSAFRADVFVAFLITTSFHVVLSPYVGPRMSPLATTWLLKYGPYMQHLTIELDMTKLGLGATPNAALMNPGLTSMEQHLTQIGRSQRKHRKVPLGQFILLCRRYHGERPATPAPASEPRIATVEQLPPIKAQSSRASTRSAKSFRSGSASSSSFHEPDSYETAPAHVMSNDQNTTARSDREDVKLCRETSQTAEVEVRPGSHFYCPDEYLSICNQLFSLQGCVSALRMCGFSDKYSHQFVATLFPEARGRFAYRLTPSGAVWPKVQGQSAWVEESQGNLCLHEHDGKSKNMSLAENKEWKGPVIPPAPVLHPDGSLSLPPRNPDRDTTPRPRRRTMIAPNTSSLSEPTGGEEVSEGDKANRIQKLLDKCGMGKDKKKRVLSRQTASTL